MINTHSTATESTRNLLALADLGERRKQTNPDSVKPAASPSPAYSTRDPSKNTNDLYIHFTDARLRDHSAARTSMKALGFRPDRDFVLLENAEPL